MKYNYAQLRKVASRAVSMDIWRIVLLVQIDQHKSLGRSTDTPCERYEFKPIKKQNSMLNRPRKIWTFLWRNSQQ